MEIEKELIIVSKRGGGTTFTSASATSDTKAACQKKLLEDVNEEMVKTLSRGYSPEELEAAFLLNLERWRGERQLVSKSATKSSPARVRRTGRSCVFTAVSFLGFEYTAQATPAA